MSCTPSGYGYCPIINKYIDKNEACEEIKQRNLRKLCFIGDSYMRHTYEGMLLILSGDYEYGAMDITGRNLAMCEGDGQFEG